MDYFIAVMIGILIVSISLFLIRRELKNVLIHRDMLSKNIDKEDVLLQLGKIEEIIEEMNEAFYSIADDLEGKYSIHEKEIEELRASLEGKGSTVKEKSKEEQVFQTEEHKKIINLYKEGISKENIAKLLGKGKREIEMIISIYNR